MDYENGDSKESRKYSKERKYYDDDYNNDGDKYYKIKQKYKERDDFRYKDKREYYRDKECYYSHKEKDKEWKDYRDKERDRRDKEKLYKYKDRSERENKRRRSKNRSVSPFSKKHSRSRSRSRSKSRHRSRSKSRSRSPARRSSHSRHISSSSSKHKSSSSSSYYEDKRYESSSYSRSNKDLPEPPPSYSQIKGQRKMMILEKLGIDLVVPGTLDKQQSGTTQTAGDTGQKGVTVTGELAAYCNITPANSRMIMERLNRKKLLWTNKTNEQKTTVESKDGANAAGGKPNTMWQSAIFSKDGDNKQTEKFKRLMGIKGDSSDESKSNAATGSSDSKDIIKRQEEMFQNMEMQYEVARASTHTHRGIGLGFGIHQYPR